MVFSTKLHLFGVGIVVEEDIGLDGVPDFLRAEMFLARKRRRDETSSTDDWLS